jgi:CheY-like chemotaxis protein
MSTTAEVRAFVAVIALILQVDENGRDSDAPEHDGLFSRSLRKHGRPLRVVVVEDESLIAMDDCAIIEELGGTVAAVAATAGEAVDAVARLRPDVVLMDVYLQGATDGVETAYIIRARRNVPIVFVTSHSDPRTLARIAAFGAGPPLLKPVSVAQLRDAILRAVQR